MTPPNAAELTAELHREIAEAFDKWRGDTVYFANEHVVFGAGYLAGKRAVDSVRAQTIEETMNKANLDAVVNRFLAWPLPKDFAPDCGISFDGRKDDQWNKNKTWPVGTNLFTADQARAMFEYCLAAQPQDVRAQTEPNDAALVDLAHSYAMAWVGNASVSQLTTGFAGAMRVALERFRAQTIEECARVCDHFAAPRVNNAKWAALRCAELIRVLGQQEIKNAGA